MPTSPTRYRIDLRALPGDSREPERRLRMALKVLLRSFALRCERVAEVRPGESSTPADDDTCNMESNGL